MYGVGSIIRIKDVEYYDKDELKILDSRLVVVIYEDDNYYYYLDISSKTKHQGVNCMRIQQSNLKTLKIIYLDSIGKRELSYLKEIAKINKQQMQEIIKNLVFYQENVEETHLYPEIKQKILINRK